MIDLKSRCLDKVIDIHDGVRYGHAQSLPDQLMRMAVLVEEKSKLSGTERDNVVAAALLHKCFDAKHTKNGIPLTREEVLSVSNPQVLSIILELESEPKEKDKSQIEQRYEKVSWAKTLSLAAREVLLAETVVNFESDAQWAAHVIRSRVAAEKGKGPDSYQLISNGKDATQCMGRVITRTMLLDALADTNPNLYAAARKARAETIIKLKALDTQNKDIFRLGFRRFHKLVNEGRAA